MLMSSLLKTNPSSKIHKRRKFATKNINLLNLKGAFPKNQYHVKGGGGKKKHRAVFGSWKFNPILAVLKRYRSFGGIVETRGTIESIILCIVNLV
jgi:hypothetical protein